MNTNKFGIFLSFFVLAVSTIALFVLPAIGDMFVAADNYGGAAFIAFAVLVFACAAIAGVLALVFFSGEAFYNRFFSRR